MPGTFEISNDQTAKDGTSVNTVHYADVTSQLLLKEFSRDLPMCAIRLSVIGIT